MKLGYPIVCKIGSLSRAEGNIDIDSTKRNYYTVHLFHIHSCIFTCTEDIELAITDKTISKRNNWLKSEMTTLGPTCRLFGFIKMDDFSPCLVSSSVLKQPLHLVLCTSLSYIQLLRGHVYRGYRGA